MSGLVVELCCRRGLAQVGDRDLCPTFPQVPLEADSRLEIFPLFNICNCIEPAETASRRDIKHSCKCLQGEAFGLSLPDFPARLYSRTVNMTCLC